LVRDVRGGLRFKNSKINLSRRSC